MLKSPPASFSHRSDPQRTPRVRLGTSLAAALLDGLLNILREYSLLCHHDQSLCRTRCETYGRYVRLPAKSECLVRAIKERRSFQR